MTAGKSSSPLSFLAGLTAAKSPDRSAFSIESQWFTPKTETRQDDKGTSKNSTPKDEREDIAEDSSTDGSSLASALDEEEIDELNEELREQQTIVKEKEMELRKYQQILFAQRQNIGNTVKEWQEALAEATTAHHEKYEGGIRIWSNTLTEATAKRDEYYEEELKKWRHAFDNASSQREFDQVKQAWNRMEAARHAPTKEMKQASERLRQLQESVNFPSKAMREAKQMVDELTKARDTPIKDMTLSKKEKKYVKNVMKWQDALAEATEKHQKHCDKWERTLNESKNTKDMKRVRRMLRRLLATRGMPTPDMEEASQMLQRLEEEKDAHLIVMRHAGSQVHKIEKELMEIRDDVTETRSLLGDAVIDQNSFDNSFSEEEESLVSQDEEEGGDWFSFKNFSLSGMIDKLAGDESSIASVSVMSKWRCAEYRVQSSWFM